MFLEIWPRTVEEAWLSYLDVDKGAQKKMKGRSDVEIINKTLETADKGGWGEI